LQRSQRFVADQRFDLPQYDSMIGLISAEFAAYNKSFMAPLNRIVKNWKINNNGGLQVIVDQTTDSTLFNSQRADHEQFILRKSTATALVLTLADNATNYVEVQMITGTCAADTVAIWDTTANGGEGQEFTQNVDTITEERPVLVSNTVAFSGANDKIQLAIVTTSGGAITNIQDERKFLFHVESDWNFGSPRSDKGIGSQKDAYDALATILKEIKGTPTWEAVGWASNKTLKQYQNLFFYGGGALSWSGTVLTLPANLSIEIAGRPYIYNVASGSYPMADGECLYVDIPPNAPGGSITPVITAIGTVPLDPAAVGFSPYIQVLFFRRGSILYGSLDIPELEAGESASIGQSISDSLQGRLGIVDDTSWVAYTSTSYISTNDSYPQALSALDDGLADVASQVAAIAADVAKEEIITSTPGQTIFNATMFTWNALNSVADIQVYRNGVKETQSQTGLAADGHFKKNSNSQIEFFNGLAGNGLITIREERTGGGTAVDLTNILVDIQPDSNGNRAVGTVSKGWKGLYLKDETSSQVYKVFISAGVLDIVPVP
jgi:hypothetical protein